MFSITDLKIGASFIINNEPYEVLEYKHSHMGRGGSVAQVKIKNLINGSVQTRSFKQADQFEEAEIEKMKAVFLYGHRGQFFFCEDGNPARNGYAHSVASGPKNRIQLNEEILGEKIQYLKQNGKLEIKFFQGKPVGIILPIKVDLKVVEAPPSIKGDTASGGTKTITLETGAKANVPLFIKQGDVVRINTSTGEYTERVQKNS